MLEMVYVCDNHSRIELINNCELSATMGNSEEIIEKVREIGLQQLELIDSQSADVEKWKSWLMQYQFNDQYLDDGYAWLTVCSQRK